MKVKQRWDSRATERAVRMMYDYLIRGVDLEHATTKYLRDFATRTGVSLFTARRDRERVIKMLRHLREEDDILAGMKNEAAD